MSTITLRLWGSNLRYFGTSFRLVNPKLCFILQHSCYAPTVAKGMYNCHIGVSKNGLNPPPPVSGEAFAPNTTKGNVVRGHITCDGNTGPSGLSPTGVQQGSSPPRSMRDFCEDPTFVAPEPLGHHAWTNEPGGSCRYSGISLLYRRD